VAEQPNRKRTKFFMYLRAILHRAQGKQQPSSLVGDFFMNASTETRIVGRDYQTPSEEDREGSERARGGG
jgi:hypothetical protein